MRQFKQIIAAAILGIAAPAMAEQAPFTSTGPFFDFGLTGQGQPGANIGQPGFAPAPFLNNSNAAQVAAQLQARQNSGLLLAVKVIEPLTNPASVAIFNQFNVGYVFADFEDAAAVGRTRALADQVIASGTSRNAYVGNFNAYPNAGNDTTRPGVINTIAQSFDGPRPNSQDYFDARGRVGTTFGRQTANQALYPGAPDYRNPAAGNSNAPNIRAALFALPIQRQTFATNGLLNRSVPTGGQATAYNTAFTGYQNGAQNIPYATRFNNWGNNSLDSDGNPNNGYAFVQNAANPSTGQLLSRGDFSSMVLHYRLRGADSIHMFNEGLGSVVGYSENQEQGDIKTGWAASGASNGGVVNGIFSRQNYGFANLTNVVGDLGGTSGDTNPRSTEVAGAVWSGVFDRAGTSRKLAILLSNLSAVTKTIDMPNLVGGFRTISGAAGSDDDYVVAAGTHRLLTFTLTNNQWRLDAGGNQAIFTDSNRNGIGIPEPTSMALVGAGALGLLIRRRRKA